MHRSGAWFEIANELKALLAGCECKEVLEPLLIARVGKLLLCKAQVKTIFRAGGGVPFSSVCIFHSQACCMDRGRGFHSGLMSFFA